MILHVFNPEHDIALASNLSNFTAPHAGRQLRYDLGFLPALWAQEGDAVLVENPERASFDYLRLVHSLKRQLGETTCFPYGNNVFLQGKQLVSTKETTCFYKGNKVFPICQQVETRNELDKILPWGWDKALKFQLKKSGVDDVLLPSDEQLNDIRNLSHRRTSAKLLPMLRQEGTIGESFECVTDLEIEELLRQYGRLVIKAPWSSSGRGLRFLDSERAPLSMHAGWIKNVLAAQGSVMAEPFYNKAKDFGMEFMCHADGKISYEGLSLFHTANGAYIGNILATENRKQEMISHYVSIELLESTKQIVCGCLPTILGGKYVGPFGIDMMIADGKLHPCVEINMRRTMGHVALAMSPKDDDLVRVMRIEYSDGTYKMKIQRP